jgi:glycosyltransferase involved in cell wall biosynthesis
LGAEAGRKVLHVVPSLLVGGAEVLLVRLVEPLRALGWSSAVATLVDEGPLRESLRALGVDLWSPAWRSGRVPWPHEVGRLVSMARALDCDVIQGWMPHGNLTGLLMRFVMPTSPPVVWGVHQSLDDLGREKALTRAVTRTAAWGSRFIDAIVYVSEASRLQHEAIGFRPERAVLIPNGVDTDLFRFSPDARRRLRRELGIPADAQVVGHVGRFHPQKDYATLGATLALVLEQSPRTHVLLVGRGVRAENHDLTRLLPLQKFSDRIHLAGERRDVDAVFSAVDIACLSSSYGEAFPTVLLEAMACGVPCVATDVGDCRRIIAGTGQIVEPANPAALSQALLGWLARCEGPGPGLRDAPRSRIVEHFSLSRAAQAYARVYDSMLARALDRTCAE